MEEVEFLYFIPRTNPDTKEVYYRLVFKNKAGELKHVKCKENHAGSKGVVLFCPKDSINPTTKDKVVQDCYSLVGLSTYNTKLEKLNLAKLDAELKALTPA